MEKVVNENYSEAIEESKERKKEFYRARYQHVKSMRKEELEKLFADA
jgi:hypothetical protein